MRSREEERDRGGLQGAGRLARQGSSAGKLMNEDEVEMQILSFIVSRA